MSNPLPYNVAEYSAAHRTRERRENGYVELTGKREKKWRGYYHDYVAQPDGSELRIKKKRIIGIKADIPTKAEAEDIHRAWLRRRAAQPVADTKKALVRHLCDDYVLMRADDWEEHQCRSVRSMFNTIVKPAIGDRPIEAINAEDLKRLVNSLATRRTVSPGRFKRVDGKLQKVPGIVKIGTSLSLTKKVITHLRGIFDLAAERDLITKNPGRSINVRLKVPKGIKKPDKTIFPPEKFEALLKQMDARDTLILWLSILGATRPNELFAIKGADVAGGAVHIQRALDYRRNEKDTKTGKPRFVHLPPMLAAEVQEWMRFKGIGPRDWLFQNRDGNPVNRDNFRKRRLRAAAKRAGLEALAVDFQMLRRSFATIAQYVGLDVKAIQQQLGHARPDMTAGEYMQPLNDLTAAQLTRLENMLRGREPIPTDAAARLATVTIQ
jgi:integrase